MVFVVLFVVSAISSVIFLRASSKSVGVESFPRKLDLSLSLLALAWSSGLVLALEAKTGARAARAGQDGGSGRRRDVAEKRAWL